MYQIEQVSFMKSEALKRKTSSTIMQSIYDKLSYLELIVHIGLLFKDELMNATDSVHGICKIDRSYFCQLEKDFNTLLDYFKRLKSAKNRKKMKDENGNLPFANKK